MMRVNRWDKYLNSWERKELEYYINKWYSFRKIWEILHRSHTTISREYRRNIMKWWVDEWKYIWKKAQHKYYVRKKYAKQDSMKIIQDMKLKEFVDHQLKKWLSPNEISWIIIREDILTHISKSSIYKYIHSPYGRKLEYLLNLEYKKRKTKAQPNKVIKLEDRIFIDQRPHYIDKREVYGDWEWDFIVSWKWGKHSLLVLHERKSRFMLVRRLKTRSIEEVHNLLESMILHLLNFNSLTLDNDIAFRRHKELWELLNTDIYFCFPYHSWEKGWVEYANRLIRRFIPKWSDISQYSDDEIQSIEVCLNNTPREILWFQSPLECMLENNQFKPGFLEYPNTLRDEINRYK